jgi:hypothetical protein
MAPMDNQDSALRDREGALAFWKPLERIENKLDGLQQLVERIFNNQNVINPKLENFMSTTPITLAQLTTDVTTLQAAVATGLTDLTAEIANLKASNPTVDFSSLDSVVNSITASVQAADPGAQSTGTASVQSAVKKS